MVAFAGWLCIFKEIKEGVQQNSKKMEIIDTRLPEALLYALDQQFEGIPITTISCDRLRSEVCEQLKAEVNTDDVLQLQLCSHRQDRGKYREDWTPIQNCEKEIEYLERPTSWVGQECIIAFCRLYCVRVTIVQPGGQIHNGNEGERLYISFNGTNHFSGMRSSPRAVAIAHCNRQEIRVKLKQVRWWNFRCQLVLWCSS